VEREEHVLVHEKLEVDACAAVGSHEDVGARPSIERDVASRIGEPTVRSVITGRRADLGVGASKDDLDTGRPERPGDGEAHEDGRRTEPPHETGAEEPGASNAAKAC